MPKKLLPSIIFIILGSLSITFSMTKQLDQFVFWIVFIGGTLVNILGIILLYFKLYESE